jgi:hypothetical protein
VRASESASELISPLLSTSFSSSRWISYLLLLELQAPSWLGVACGAPKLHVLVSDLSNLEAAKGRLHSSRSKCSSWVSQQRRRFPVRN